MLTFPIKNIILKRLNDYGVKLSSQIKKLISNPQHDKRMHIMKHVETNTVHQIVEHVSIESTSRQIENYFR